ncbi:hypothetical protein [Halorubrum ezzemoulense]|uniref:hypothetical protein n=1 Tax=Halorubrum ezzemoulense TaxID=337243 RepID=UPI001179CA1F|nr:hypothetical protein [Halorubrum ezzemoulense]
MANRRKFLAGLGALASGSAAAMGTGAFTNVSAQRTVSVDVADDSSAYLTLTQAGTGPNSQYAETSNGEISINLDNSDTTNGGAGLNLESETDIFDIFRIQNSGTQPVFVYVDPSSVTPDYVTPDGGGGYAGSPGNPNGGGIYIDPQATNRPNTGNANLPDGISLTGIYGVNDPTQGFEGSDSGSGDYKAEDLTLGVGEELSFGLFIRTGESVNRDFDVSMDIVADADLAADLS